MRNSKDISQYRTNQEYFKNFFTRNLKEWNTFDSDIRGSESVNVFKNKILRFIRPKSNSFFNCLNAKGVKLITTIKEQQYIHLHLPNRLFQWIFFYSTLNDWFSLDLKITNSEPIPIFKSRLLFFDRPVQTNIYNIFNPKSLTFRTHLRLGFSHLNQHKFRHNFHNWIPYGSCSWEVEDTSYYLLHCHHFSHHRVDLMNGVKSICDNFESMPDNVKEDLHLYDDSRFDENKNKVILKATISFIRNTERFYGSLFDSCFFTD